MEPMLMLLSSDDRMILQRIDMLGESQAEVARELGMSISGLKSRVQRARQRLRAQLEGCCAVERDRTGQPTDYQRRPDRPCPCDGCA
jgi:RNA polymerase sigma-70 factor (ECF subfamily)